MRPFRETGSYQAAGPSPWTSAQRQLPGPVLKALRRWRTRCQSLSRPPLRSVWWCQLQLRCSLHHACRLHLVPSGSLALSFFSRDAHPFLTPQCMSNRPMIGVFSTFSKPGTCSYSMSPNARRPWLKAFGAAQQGLQAATMLMQCLRHFTATSSLRHRSRRPQMMLVRPWSSGPT